jgi:hypothetical protein
MFKIRLLLGTTFNRGKDTEMSIGRKGCCWEQRSTEERAHECSPVGQMLLSLGSKVQKKAGWELSLEATFKGGKDT